MNSNIYFFIFIFKDLTTIIGLVDKGGFDMGKYSKRAQD
jgi:hypothetical protein